MFLLSICLDSWVKFFFFVFFCLAGCTTFRRILSFTPFLIFFKTEKPVFTEVTVRQVMVDSEETNRSDFHYVLCFPHVSPVSAFWPWLLGLEQPHAMSVVVMKMESEDNNTLGYGKTHLDFECSEHLTVRQPCENSSLFPPPICLFSLKLSYWDVFICPEIFVLEHHLTMLPQIFGVPSKLSGAMLRIAHGVKCRSINDHLPIHLQADVVKFKRCPSSFELIYMSVKEQL